MARRSPPAIQPPLSEGEEEEREEQPPSEAANQAEIPRDGYEWKKYGQKYIRHISKIRGYFKCKNNRCNARKRVEWPPSNPSRLRVIYCGAHCHRQPQPQFAADQEASSSAANRFDLRTQVFGPPSNPP